MVEVPMILVKHYGVLSQNKRMWTRELNLISWNGHEPRYDIRDWSTDKKKSSKGMTFSLDEILNLKEILSELTFEERLQSEPYQEHEDHFLHNE